jgi:hypothetical protein
LFFFVCRSNTLVCLAHSLIDPLTSGHVGVAFSQAHSQLHGFPVPLPHTGIRSAANRYLL